VNAGRASLLTQGLLGQEGGCVCAHNEYQCYCGAWVGTGRSVALLICFLSQIWKLSSSHTGKQAQSQPDSDQGGIHLAFVSLF